MLHSLPAPADPSPPQAQTNNASLVEHWSIHPSTLPPKRGTESSLVAKAISLLNKTPAPIKKPEQASLDTPPSACAPPLPPSSAADEMSDPKSLSAGEGVGSLVRPPIVPSQFEEQGVGGGDHHYAFDEDPSKAFFAAHFPLLASTVPLSSPSGMQADFELMRSLHSHPYSSLSWQQVKMEETAWQLPLQPGLAINAYNNDEWWADGSISTSASGSTSSSCPPSSSGSSQTEDWMNLVDLTNTSDTPAPLPPTTFPPVYSGIAAFQGNIALKQEGEGWSPDRNSVNDNFAGAGLGEMQFTPIETYPALPPLSSIPNAAPPMMGPFGVPETMVDAQVCAGVGVGVELTHNKASSLALHPAPHLGSGLGSDLALHLAPNLACGPATNLASASLSHGSVYRPISPISPLCLPLTSSSSSPHTPTPSSVSATKPQRNFKLKPKALTKRQPKPLVQLISSTPTKGVPLYHMRSLPQPPPLPNATIKLATSSTDSPDKCGPRTTTTTSSPRPKPANLTCLHPGCKKTFSSTHNLQEHAQIHQFPRVRTYECQDCGSPYFYKRDLQRHIRKKHEAQAALLGVELKFKGKDRKSRVAKLAASRVMIAKSGRRVCT
ncbi:hypothetical protein NDA13_002927 [Ustilago tritici]|nr:hypothetical protein NDA13_002927 [Ustilago tritici]